MNYGELFEIKTKEKSMFGGENECWNLFTEFDFDENGRYARRP